MPPRGRYLAHEVGWLAGVSGDRIGQWARRGYIRASQSSEAPPYEYSYQDVAEAIIIHDLLERGVDLLAIKRAIETLREDPQFGDWPLAKAILWVPHKTERASKRRSTGSPSLVVEAGGRPHDVGVSRRAWQEVLTTADLERVASDLRRGGWAVRELPDLRFVEVDPDRLSGRPTIKGRRIPAQDVAETAETVGGKRLLKREYELTDAQIRDAQRWWRAVQGWQDAA